MAHKTLVIGLGSTGAEIVSHAIDGVVERFGSLEAAPWFQAVAFDTADVDHEDSVVDTGNFERIGLPATDYADFLGPEDRLSRIEFSRWAQREIFLQSNSSANGASNIRMIGRASFLHPSTFLKFETAVNHRLQKLYGLNLAQAMAAANLPVDNPSLIIDTAYNVFIVGSLVGGTCSGCFIDAGYYLRWLLQQAQRSGVHTNVLGIFSIPHQTYQGERRLANVYAALTELNHFLSNGVRYRQLFSTHSRPVEFTGHAPFDSTSLISPKTSDDIERKKIHAALGEFIAVSAVSEMAEVTWTKTVDPQGNVAARKHKGRHLNFMSLGISALEYPADHIARACAARLTAGAIETWLQQPGIEPGAADVELDRMELTQEAIRKRFLAPGDGQMDMSSLIEIKLNSALSQIEQNRTSAMANFRAQIEEGFQSHPPVTDGLGPNTVNEAINRNQQATREDYLQRFSDRIDQALLTTGEGPGWCEGFAQALLRRVASIRASAVAQDAHQRAPGLAKKLAEAETRIRESSALGVPAFRSIALAKHGGKWKDVSRSYWRCRLEDATGQAETDLLATLSAFAEKVAERIDRDGNNSSLVKIFRQILASSAKEASDLTGKGPVVNGYALFSEKIVNSEYEEAMSQIVPVHDIHIGPSLRTEAYARARLLLDFLPLQGCLTGRTSAFDPGIDVDLASVVRKKPSDTLGERLRRQAMRHFEHMHERDVLKLLYKDPSTEDPMAAATVKQVWDDGKFFIEVDDTESPFARSGADVGFLTPAFVFHFQAGAQTWPYAKFEADFPKQPTGFVAIGDPKRAIVVRAKLGFSAEQIKGVDNYRHAAEEEIRVGAPLIYSRNDLVWHPINGDPIHPNIDEGIGAFLYGLAKGLISINPNPQGERFLLHIPYDEEEASVPLPVDVELAGYRLLTHGNGKGYAYLSDVVRMDNTPTRRTEAVSRIFLMASHHETKFRQLRYRNSELTKSEVRNRQLNFVRATGNSDIETEYWAAHKPAHESRPEIYFKKDGPTGNRTDGNSYPEGYYCNGKIGEKDCLEYLMGPGENEINFPERCSNCGKQLLIPGYHERNPQQHEENRGIPASARGNDPFAKEFATQSRNTAETAHLSPQAVNSNDGWDD